MYHARIVYTYIKDGRLNDVWHLVLGKWLKSQLLYNLDSKTREFDNLSLRKFVRPFRGIHENTNNIMFVQLHIGRA